MLEVPGFGRVEDRMDFAVRQLCHILIDQFDRNGLQDVFQSLVEFYEYYKPKMIPTSLLPKIESLDAATGNWSVRPVFSLEED